MEFITHSPEETENIGAALGKQLKPGTVIAYCGDLGAGKTAFTRGLARGLGAGDMVTSPTYDNHIFHKLYKNHFLLEFLNVLSLKNLQLNFFVLLSQ